jgi:hypothetical protein
VPARSTTDIQDTVVGFDVQPVKIDRDHKSPPDTLRWSFQPL